MLLNTMQDNFLIVFQRIMVEYRLDILDRLDLRFLREMDAYQKNFFLR